MKQSLWGMLALAAGLAGIASTDARADTESCTQFRNNILYMESTSVRPPGWIMLDGYLRRLYASACVSAPTRRADAAYRYREDGTPLGIRADFTPLNWDKDYPYRPDGAAYTTTPEIASACANALPFNPGMCAMMKGLEAACLKPVDTQQRTQCAALLEGRTPDLPPPSEPLPPIADLLGPARAGAPQLSNAEIRADAGFQRMCADADNNFKICTMRRANMASLGDGQGGGGNATTGQAGAFAQCQTIYSGVLNMCAATKVPMPRSSYAVPPAAAPKAAPPPPQPAAGNQPQHSSAPPPAAPQMSAQCQALVKNLVAAAESNQGAKSNAGYNSLKQAGGCGVLDKFDRAPPPAAGGDSRFVARGSTPLSDGVMGSCDSAPDECAARVQQLRAGTSPEAVAALWTNAIGIGLDIGNALASGMVAGMPSYTGGGGAVRGPSGGSDMSSIGNRPVRSTYGQGAPAYRPAPTQRPSDITGTSR